MIKGNEKKPTEKSTEQSKVDDEIAENKTKAAVAQAKATANSQPKTDRSLKLAMPEDPKFFCELPDPNTDNVLKVNWKLCEKMGKRALESQASGADGASLQDIMALVMLRVRDGEYIEY